MRAAHLGRCSRLSAAPDIERECFSSAPSATKGRRSAPVDTVLAEVVAKAAADLGLEAIRETASPAPGVRGRPRLAEARAAAPPDRENRDSVQRSAAERGKADRPHRQEGGGTPVNAMGWDDLRDEQDPASLEVAAKVVEQIRASYVSGQDEVADLVHQSFSQRERRLRPATRSGAGWAGGGWSAASSRSRSPPPGFPSLG